MVSDSSSTSNFLDPKLLKPLGASAIASFNPSSIFSNGIPEYIAPKSANFSDYPFFFENRSLKITTAIEKEDNSRDRSERIQKNSQHSIVDPKSNIQSHVSDIPAKNQEAVAPKLETPVGNNQTIAPKTVETTNKLIVSDNQTIAPKTVETTKEPIVSDNQEIITPKLEETPISDRQGNITAPPRETPVSESQTITPKLETADEPGVSNNPETIAPKLEETPISDRQGNITAPPTATPVSESQTITPKLETPISDRQPNIATPQTATPISENQTISPKKVETANSRRVEDHPNTIHQLNNINDNTSLQSNKHKSTEAPKSIINSSINNQINRKPDPSVPARWESISELIGKSTSSNNELNAKPENNFSSKRINANKNNKSKINKNRYPISFSNSRKNNLVNRNSNTHLAQLVTEQPKSSGYQYEKLNSQIVLPKKVSAKNSSIQESSNHNSSLKKKISAEDKSSNKNIEEKNNEDDKLDILAEEIYYLLKQKFKSERERQGQYYI